MKSYTRKEHETINKNRRLFDRSCRPDVINLNAGNSLNHEMTKAYLCMQLAREGRSFLTEAKFSNNIRSGRADIVDLSTGRIIEVIESEKEESIEAKRKYYPLNVFVVKARQVILP